MSEIFISVPSICRQFVDYKYFNITILLIVRCFSVEVGVGNLSLSSSRVVNVAVIGLGAFMGEKQLPRLIRSPGVTLHTICDRNEQRLADRAAQYRPARSVTNSEAVFDDPAIDAVIVGTRHDQHAPMIESAVLSGKHILVEKPMTCTLEESRHVLDLAGRHPGVQVGVGFNRRFAPAMIAAKRAYRSVRSGPSNIVYRIVDDHHLRPRYIFDMDDGGGHLLLEGCHIFDLLAWFLEEEPVEVYAKGPLATDNVVLITFSDGSIATIVCGGKGGACYPKECMEVFNNRTTIAVDQFFELRIDGPSGNEISHFQVESDAGTDLPIHNMSEFYSHSFSQRPAGEDVTKQTLHDSLRLAPDKGHAGLIDAFISAIVRRDTFSIGPVDGARATMCALMGYESIRRQAPVEIDPGLYQVSASR